MENNNRKEKTKDQVTEEMSMACLFRNYIRKQVTRVIEGEIKITSESSKGKFNRLLKISPWFFLKISNCKKKEKLILIN